MSTHIDGHDRTMKVLPGSAERMVGGPHMCMYHNIESSPLQLEDWACTSVYMHVAYEREPPRPYLGPECSAVLSGINVMNGNHVVASGVLLKGDHAAGHPLPGVYTVLSPGYRVDFRMYPHNHKKHLWAELIKM